MVKLINKFSKLLVSAFILTAVMGFAAKKITIKGSTTVLPVAQGCAKAFMDKNSGVVITVAGGGSTTGIKALIDGSADIGNASRNIKDSEVAKAKAKGINPYENVVARDGIAVVVHKDNPIDNMKVETIAKIYTGKITKWEDLGWKEAKGWFFSWKILAVSRDTSSGTYGAFKDMVLKKLGKQTRVMPGAQKVASNKAAAATVLKNKKAIGYVGMAFTKGLKTVAVNGVKPSDYTVKTGKYPIARGLNMYTNGAPTGIVKKFIDFIKSPEGQKIVERVGYIKL